MNIDGKIKTPKVNNYFRKNYNKNRKQHDCNNYERKQNKSYHMRKKEMFKEYLDEELLNYNL